jgi:hypothetical protein
MLLNASCIISPDSCQAGGRVARGYMMQEHTGLLLAAWIILGNGALLFLVGPGRHR